MIASWMLYCALCALGLSIAAVLAERVLLAGRAPVRAVWFTTVLLSLVMPAVALRYASRPQPVSVASSAREGAVLDESTVLASGESPPVVGTALAQSPQTSRFNWRATVAGADRPLTIAWLALSAALALYFLGGVAAIALMRRGWRRRVILGVPVLVSERTGPALVGALSPAIVLPEWALEMDPKQLALMLLHEEEHRRARDGQLLTAAHVALVVMPWNVALWWQVWRLRMAVELDCDARVLRDADARSYGDLLLEVVRPGRGLRLMGATAFADRAAQLERRIRVLTSRRERAVRGTRTAVAFIGLATLTAAWAAPRPMMPAHVNSAPPKGDVPAAAQPPRDLPEPVNVPVVTRAAATDSTRRTNALPRGDTIITVVRDSDGVDRVFHRLFDGIVMSASQEAAARTLLANLEQQEMAEQVSRVSAVMRSLSLRQALQTERDSALRTLITTDEDRAVFDSRIVAADAGGARVGGGRAGGARVGRGSADQSTSASLATEDATFHRLLDGITLSPAAEAEARVVIATHLEAQQTLIPPANIYLEMLSPALVTMQAQSQAVLLALLTNDSDRYQLQARIVVARPQPRTPQQ